MQLCFVRGIETIAGPKRLQEFGPHSGPFLDRLNPAEFIRLGRIGRWHSSPEGAGQQSPGRRPRGKPGACGRARVYRKSASRTRILLRNRPANRPKTAKITSYMVLTAEGCLKPGAPEAGEPTLEPMRQPMRPVLKIKEAVTGCRPERRIFGLHPFDFPKWPHSSSVRL